MHVFYAVSKHGGKFKALFELIFQNMTTACFTIDKSGMYMECMTTQNTLFKIMIGVDSFDTYEFTNPEPLFIGLNSSVNRNFFKSIKNNDVFSMKIESTKQTLDLENQYTSDNVSIKLAVIIENIQNIEKNKEYEYLSPPITIFSRMLNLLCRSLHAIPLTQIVKQYGQISFIFDAQLNTKTITFGESRRNDLELVDNTYYSDQFNRIIKLCHLADSVEAKLEKDKPFYLHCQSVICWIKIYINHKTE